MESQSAPKKWPAERPSPHEAVGRGVLKRMPRHGLTRWVRSDAPRSMVPSGDADGLLRWMVPTQLFVAGRSACLPLTCSTALRRDASSSVLYDEAESYDPGGDCRGPLLAYRMFAR